MLKVYVSEKANRKLTDYLEAEGIDVVRVGRKGNVSEPVACHPDIYYCLLKDGIYEGDASLLSAEYPGDVLYNAAVAGRYFICSSHTSEDLVKKALSQGLIPIKVPQGYVKCNLAVLDGSHVITEDRGIAKALSVIPDIECLLVNPHEVKLPGYDYGFIGGACGRVGNKMIFNGDLSSHSCFEEIVSMCRRCGLEAVYFGSYPLTDIGSILAVRE